MLLYVIFLQYISIVSASHDLLSTFVKDFTVNDDNEVLRRNPRDNLKPRKKDEFKEDSPTCDQLGQTSLTPFIVIMLFRTSGRFLGMGSIIDKKTILTAARVVEHSMRHPDTLLILAGRLTPWWGEGSQVKHASEIFQNDLGLALVILKNELQYNKNILPITLPTGPVYKEPTEFNEEYDQHWAVFGIPRSSWDIPGDRTSKTTIYVMRAETVTQKKEHSDACKASYPDVEFNDTVMECTYANGTFCWGCLGSPTIAVNQADKLLQIAVITSASYSETDEYHIHVKVGFFEQWIRSHSLVGFKKVKS